MVLWLQCAPIRGRVQKILTWRWKEPPKIADELDHVTPHSPNKKKVSLVYPHSLTFYQSYRTHTCFACIGTYMPLTKIDV